MDTTKEQAYLDGMYKVYVYDIFDLMCIYLFVMI